MGILDYRPQVAGTQPTRPAMPKEVRGTPPMLEGPLILSVRKGTNLINEFPTLPPLLASCISFSVQGSTKGWEVYGMTADGTPSALTGPPGDHHFYVRVDYPQAALWETKMESYRGGRTLVLAKIGGGFRSLACNEGLNFVRLLQEQ